MLDEQQKLLKIILNSKTNAHRQSIVLHFYAILLPSEHIS